MKPFQSARPRGARLWGLRCPATPPVFQSARPRGARLQRQIAEAPRRVSIRAPTRGATGLEGRVRARDRFNPRAHEGRDHRAHAHHGIGAGFQSARPRGARLHLAAARMPACDVSIRAPTRGATCTRNCSRSAATCFNPRAHEGRDKRRPELEGQRRFQSARPRGARHRCLRHYPLTKRVSIRAPTRGATLGLASPRSRYSGFNPRAHEGRDSRHDSACRQSTMFQSARPRGARHALGRVDGRVWRVVSIRAPTRGATAGIVLDESSILFQSARPRGARRHPQPGHAPPSAARFNPRAHEGRDITKRGGNIQKIGVSIRAPTRGATAADYGQDFDDDVSIRAPTRGATPWRVAWNRREHGFNPRAHEGRDSPPL